MRRALIDTLITWVSLTQAIQPGAVPARPAPLRDLQLGDINFLHTTDTHGWHAGHLLESSFSADWGDYISFAHHLREKVEAEGKDLLVIDTGDRIEGNGLYDASSPRGEYTFGIFKQQHIDILCTGNHELYKNSSAEDDFLKLVPAYGEHYLASNLLIRNHKNGQLVPLASTHRKFTTKHGLHIMAFGFIFDFNRNDKNTLVLPVEEVVTYPWFEDAINEDNVDLFIVIGHVALRQKEFEIIHQAIRRLKPNTPIQFFGGHFHIRDYRVFDDKSHALASGRFMETIGFQSISNVKPGPRGISFARRYIDNNLFGLHYHSNTTDTTFDTKLGRYTTQKITHARTALNLDETFGCAPKTYWMSRSVYNAKDSVYYLIADQILPSIVNPDRSNKTRMVMTNTGAIRFDIFAGPFTRDSTFIISPFTSNMSFIPDVPYRLAKQLLPILNEGDPVTLDHLKILTYNKKFKFDLDNLLPPEQVARRDGNANRNRLSNQHPNEQEYHSGSSRADYDPALIITPGYTTTDDLGTDGDDTIHSTIPEYDVPHAVQAVIPGPDSSIQKSTFPPDPLPSSSLTDNYSNSDDEVVDLIFNQFLTPYIIYLLNLLPYLDTAYKGTLDDYEDYLTGLNWKILDYRIEPGHGVREYSGIPPCVKQGLCEDLPLPSDAQNTLDPSTAEDDDTTFSVFIDHEKCISHRYLDETDEEHFTRCSLFLSELKKQRRDKEAMRLDRPTYTEDDVSNYIPGETFTTLFAKWVVQNWAGNCEDQDKPATRNSGGEQSGDGEL